MRQDEVRSDCDITLLLQNWGEGDRNARDQLINMVYHEVLKIAKAKKRRELNWSNPTMDLAHEAFQKVLNVDQSGGVAWKNRKHFFATLAKMMQFVLISNARYKRKRAGQHFTDDQLEDPFELQPRMLRGGCILQERGLDFRRALQKLRVADERKYRVAVRKAFYGYSAAEIGAQLGVDERTVERDWKMCKAFIRRELAEV